MTVGGLDTDGLNAYMPGFNEASPRSQQEKMSDFLAGELHNKNIVPARIYSMADTRRSGEVKFSAILESMNKILPNLTPEFLEQVPLAFGMNYGEHLSPDEFNMLFDPKSTAANTIPKPSATKVANARKAREGNDEYTALLKYLAEEIKKTGDTPLRFFKMADKNFNQVLTVDEIKEHIKNTLPDSFAGLNFKKLTKALDTNMNGILEQQEFVDLMDKTIRANAPTDQFNKISGALGGGYRKQQTKTSNTKTVVEAIMPQHRLNAEEVIAEMYKLIECEKNVSEPVDEIQSIF